MNELTRISSKHLDLDGLLQITLPPTLDPKIN